MFIERLKLKNIADQISVWLSSDHFECLDVDWDASSRTLRVYIDHLHGVGFEQCTAVSQLLIAKDELDDLIPCEFNLEVSSPGIERPLRTLDHFKKSFEDGASINVKLTEKVHNRRHGIGTITSINNSLLTLKTAEGVWEFPVEMVLKAFQLADWDNVIKNAKQDVNVS